MATDGKQPQPNGDRTQMEGVPGQSRWQMHDQPTGYSPFKEFLTMTPSKDRPLDMVVRTDYPDEARMLAVLDLVGDLAKFGETDTHVHVMLDFLHAAQVGLHGKAREDALEAVIGDMRNRYSRQVGFERYGTSTESQIGPSNAQRSGNLSGT